MMREEIFETAHLNSSRDLARKYFEQSGINFADLTLEDFDKLRLFINIEIQKLLADPSYSMISKLMVKPKIKKEKSGVFLRASGNYFPDREAISFYNRGPFFIGFCVWANGCNQTPFMKGFIDWVDFLTKGK